ncbi:MAG: Smr/MutS family protein [Bacteroidales bacterium]
MIYPGNFEEKTGFDKIRFHLKNYCISTLGKNKVDAIKFETSFNQVKTNLALVNEYVEIHKEKESLTIQHFYDVRESLNKIKIEGNYIGPEELFDIIRSLEEIKAITRFITQSEEGKYPNLKMLAAEVPIFPYVIERINKILNKDGKIKDNASKELLQIRQALQSKISGVSRIMHGLLQKAKSENIVEQDTQLTIRDGKMLIPVPAASKRKIKGYVADESATGKTSFIEPLEIIEINNEIRELEFAEKREIIKILIELCNDLRPYTEDLLISYDFLAEIDFIRAKAIFAIRINACMPALSGKPGFNIKTAIHPLLYLSFEKEGRKVVPLDIWLDRNQKIILISGPNAGGKSVCLKTVGLFQYMLQCGLLVPLDASSEIGIFNDIFIDIGDEQSIEDDLSTYSSHLKNMKKLLENASDTTLFLIDEFGSGTEPSLGGAIAEAMLEELLLSGAYGIVTTHYGNLKHFAGSASNMVNGAMLFDNHRMKAIYELEIGRPGSSFAFEIAKNIGLSAKILNSAEQKIGKNQIDFEKYLQEIEKERRQITNTNKRISQKEFQLDQVLKKYEEEIKLTTQKRKDIIKEAKLAAEKILSNVNKTIENSVFEIKKTNADKEKLKKIRSNVEILKEETSKRFEAEEKFLSKKAEKIQNQKKKTENIEKKEEVEEYNTGDKVSLKSGQGIGEILEIKDNKVLISLGNMQMFVDKTQLKKISEKQYKNQTVKTTVKTNESYEISDAKGNFAYGLDVRGKRADEALQLVTRYIDECIMVEAHEVRILHGKGNGILRQLIRDYLKSMKIVLSAKDEKVEFGGAGITVVTFNF